MSNLTTRILVALVGIPLILLLTWAGGVYFFAFVALVSSLSLYEYYQLARAKGTQPQVTVGLLFGLCVMMAFMYNRLPFFPLMPHWLLITVLLFVPAIFFIELFRGKASAMANVAMTLAGVLYVSLGLGSLVGLRELPAVAGVDVGASVVITIFASVWICDSAAYFVGMRFGRHKLLERVSPNKTWEGAVGGFIGAVIVFLVARDIGLQHLSVSNVLVSGCIVGIFGQIGDLVESLLKRDAGVKDSSSLIPGHGGALDRFDSIIFISPLMFLYLHFLAS